MATALRLTVWPGQAVVGLAVKLLMIAAALMVNVVLAVAVQPAAFVTVTV